MINSVEIERKYVIKMPDLGILSQLEGYSESEIVQIYLTSQPGVTHRIRKRTTCGTSVFTETEKRRIDKISSFESEREIDEERFSKLIKSIRAGSRPITKVRITFIYKERLFEIDVYPEWKKSCIMEIELPSREEKIEMPPFIDIVAEVTGERAYSNSSMANAFPRELI